MSVDWSKVGRKSRNKGARLERNIATKLSKLTGHKFRRTPASGGMEWKGDIILADPGKKLPFIIECKNRHIAFDKEFLTDYKTLKSWAAEYNGKEVFLFFSTSSRIVMTALFCTVPCRAIIHDLMWGLRQIDLTLKKGVYQNGTNRGLIS